MNSFVKLSLTAIFWSGPGHAVPFALTPGTATNGVIDFTVKAGKSHFGYATRPLETELYDCDSDNCYQFIQSVKTRAQEYGWSALNGIFWVPLTAHPNSEILNFIEEFGQFTMERIKEHAISFIYTPTRAAQDDRML
mmetsp:Transcript_35132/g.52224  ORF Transcript_35132/g.52224 Transcript_35132/m.52224 type:complete len:137 (+) Transcript_35132:84-494(+)